MFGFVVPLLVTTQRSLRVVRQETATHFYAQANRLLLLLAVVVVASASTVIATSGAFIPARFSASSSVSKQNKNKK